MAAAQPTLQSVQYSGPAIVPSHIDCSFAFRTADELCDALMDHMIDCPACLHSAASFSGTEADDCEIYACLREQIAVAGGATSGKLLAL